MKTNSTSSDKIINNIITVFNDNVEPFDSNVDMTYNTEDSKWCSDHFLFVSITHLPTTMILASHEKFFRPCILVSDTLAFDDSNFTVIDVDTLTIKHIEGNCKELDSNIIPWISKNRIKLIECWLRENTILPLTRRLGESYKFDEL